MERADVLIVGGGPAGSSCAARLVAAGRDVLVVEARAFPRDKPCAGWITPAVVGETGLDLAEYGRRNTLQPISRFRVGRIGGRSVDVEYDEPVSYGIRRCEFDVALLHRSRARVRSGERVSTVRREGGEWVLDGQLAAPVLVGAGGHFCPVAREIAGRPDPGSLVVSREIEYPLEDRALERCRVEPLRPELYFCPDLRGYGWCFRKGRYLNIGLGRRDPRRLGPHVSDFARWLVVEGRIASPPESGWRGHAYLLRQGRPRRLVADGALLVGDAAGLAFAASGEGILPAIVSGRVAADTLLAAGTEPTEERLRAYPRRLAEALGKPSSGRALPGPLAALGGAVLLSSPGLVRHLVLDRLFLHRSPRRDRAALRFGDAETGVASGLSTSATGH